jgi:hypothetical protein
VLVVQAVYLETEQMAILEQMREQIPARAVAVDLLQVPTAAPVWSSLNG